MSRVLVVDDESGIRAVLAESLAGAGHETAEAADVAEALQRLEDGPYDVMLSDLRMPGPRDGMDLVRLARARWPQMQIIVLTAHGSIGSAVEAMKLGAFDFLEKPIASPADLRALVQRALNWRGAPGPQPARHGAARQGDGLAARESGDRASTHGMLASEAADESAAPARVPAVAGVDLADLERAPVGHVSGFLWQLKRRRVYSVAVGYAAVGFLGLQAAELVVPALPYADSLYRVLVAIVLAGFPVALLLGWVFDITSKGILRTPAGPGPLTHRVTGLDGRRADPAPAGAESARSGASRIREPAPERGIAGS
ncbi:MAG: response regulator [Gemmatimonadetes bacterium]|nr:response regulator [Gemmatimonadota bacterium]